MSRYILCCVLIVCTVCLCMSHLYIYIYMVMQQDLTHGGKKLTGIDVGLKQKKAWEVAQAPAKQVGMMAFMVRVRLSLHCASSRYPPDPLSSRLPSFRCCANERLRLSTYAIVTWCFSSPWWSWWCTVYVVVSFRSRCG